MPEDQMKEVAVKPDGRSHTVTISDSQELNVDTAEADIHKVLVNLNKGDKTRSRNFVSKRFRQEILLGERSIDKYIENYVFLKTHGFPVPTTVRHVEGKNELLVTDLSQGGNKIVFSQNEIGTKYQSPVINNMAELQEELSRLGRKADELGIRVGADAYFFVVDQSNQAKIVMADLGMGVNLDKWSDQPNFSEIRAQKIFQRLETWD